MLMERNLQDANAVIRADFRCLVHSFIHAGVEAYRCTRELNICMFTSLLLVVH